MAVSASGIKEVKKYGWVELQTLNSNPDSATLYAE